MVGHQLGLVAVQRYLVERAAVSLSEIGHLEVALQNLGLAQEAAFDNLVGLELLLGADHIVAGVQVVHLGCELLGFLLCGLFLLDHSLVDGAERVHALIQVLDLDMGSLELAGQAINSLLLLLKLQLQAGNGLLHLAVIVGGLLEALLQVIEALFVLIDGLLDEYDVVAQLLLAVWRLTTQVVHRHDIF